MLFTIIVIIVNAHASWGRMPNSFCHEEASRTVVIPKEKTHSIPFTPFLLCQGVTQVLLQFLSPESFFPLHPSLYPPCHHILRLLCECFPCKKKNLENSFKPNRKIILLSLKSIKFVSLPWHRTSAGLKTSPVSEDVKRFVDLRG